MAWKTGLGLRRRLIAAGARILTKPLRSYVQRVPNNIDSLKGTLRKGDVLLVEGDQRVSQVIRYLTQSSWSHSALYVGNQLLKGPSERAADLVERFGPEAEHLLIEAVLGEGVIASPLGKYRNYNIRVCRPERLRRDDVERVIDYAAGHLGDGYDVQHIYQLARYFFPVEIVPQRWRRATLHLGSGSEREVICSSMIAKAFARVGFPIAPEVTIEEGAGTQRWWRALLGLNGHRPVARFRRKDPALVTPRDFDLSPYFEIVKFNHLADPRFSYREIVWEESSPAEKASAPAAVASALPDA
jgi:hypothetical protein